MNKGNDIRDIFYNTHMFQLIIEQMNCLVITDPHGRYIYANKAWEDIMQINFIQVKGKRVIDIVKNSKIMIALGQRKSVTDHSTITVNGTEREAYSIYTPILDGQNVVAGVILTIMTSDDRKEYIKKIQLLLDEMKYYKNELSNIRGAKYSIESIIGDSPAMVELKTAIRVAARSRSTVLIEAETGCGKELVSHAIHNLSSRSAEPFVKVNCASIPSELLETEFFGYNEGAFTGARRQGRAGKFEQANRGSLFLDEINHLSMQLQPKFLRVLQENEIERLGGETSIQVDVRIIASSNVPLEKMVREGKFREDLYYRLNVLKIQIPPLRERKEDIPLLVDHLVNEINNSLGFQVPPVDPAIKEMLMDYHWPGNIRELRNVLERAMNAAYGDTLKPAHFKGWFSVKSHNTKPCAPFGDYSVKELISNSEKHAIIAALTQYSNKTAAAQALGFSRTTLYKKMKRYNIDM